MDAPSSQDNEHSPVAKTKKPTASLLPAFEPLSSSQALPRQPLKRTRDAYEETRLYPTPVPTSSTHILSSSPPQTSSIRPPINRSLSTVSERAPLSAVPTITLNTDSKPIRLGRSSASSDYQLSANRLISRVHVEVTYLPALSRLHRERVEVVCRGWNGVKIHCQSQVHELKKDEMFSSDIRHAEIMLDVHDSRVVLQWPEKTHLGPTSSDEEGDFESPSKRQRAMLRHSTPPSPSPLQTRKVRTITVSPSPAVRALLPSSPPSMLAKDHAPVEIYEDPVPAPVEQANDKFTHPSQLTTQPLSQPLYHQSPKSQAEVPDEGQDFSDNDEENDPIIHSFGPLGANLLPRMAAFTAGGSPNSSASMKGPRSSYTEPLQPMLSPPQLTRTGGDVDLRSHVINQLAFSRLSSTPLSTILSHLPHDERLPTKEEMREIINDTKCIGEVAREGKDAAGKALESEFYYIPDEDDDEMRKGAVVNDLRKPGLRACRKQHKQYFWRKPK